MVRIRERFKHREICPSRVWWIMEMVGLTICYKSDSWTTISITRFQRQHHLDIIHKRGEINLRYLGPFNISDSMGLVAYRLELPLELSSLHNKFHIPIHKYGLSDDPHLVPIEGTQLDNKHHFCGITNWNHGPRGQANENKVGLLSWNPPEFPKKSRFHLWAGRPDATKISSSFHRVHSRDQHKLNFGTKFLLGGKTVTTRNFRSFFKRRNFIIYLGKLLFISYNSSFTIHQLLFIDHYSSSYYSSFSRSIRHSEKRSEILLFTWHYSFPEENHYSRALLISS